MTDLLLEMVAKAARQDQAFLIDLAALQEKHIETAKLLLGDGPALNKFAARLLDDIGNLKAMLHAISIGAPRVPTRKYSGQPLTVLYTHSVCCAQRTQAILLSALLYK